MTRRAERPVASKPSVAASDRGLELVHVPGLGGHMEARITELVVPGRVETLQVVVAELAVVEAVHPDIEVIEIVGRRIAHHRSQGRLGGIAQRAYVVAGG